MGYALPAAVGVKVAQPDRQTVVVCGDGSFQMAMNELSAIKYTNMDIKIVLFRNNVLGLVNQIQNLDDETIQQIQDVLSQYGVTQAQIDALFENLE